MKSYLSLIPISAKVHRRQNRMTLLCIVFAVFMVTAVFSMAEMGFRMEQARLVGKHGSFSIGDLLGSSMGQTLLSVAVVLFLLILVAGVLMISSSMNSSVAQRTKFFGMMRCIGMSKQQIIRFVRLEALNWCKTAVPIGLILGVVTTWGLCAVLRFVVREEFSDIPLFGISIFGIACGIFVGLITVLIAANAPAKHAAKVSPITAVSGNGEPVSINGQALSTGGSATVAIPNSGKTDIVVGIGAKTYMLTILRNSGTGGSGGGGGSGYSYYTIKATAGTGGSISPSGNVSVREGGDQTFTITPDKGYAVANVKIDGKRIGAVKSYTFENVRRTHTIEVIFVKGTASASTGDSSNLPLWSALLLTSTITLAGAVHYKRKRAR